MNVQVIHIADERQRSRDAIRRCVDRAVHMGHLRADVDAEGLATLGEALLVGISIQARDGVSQEALEAAVSNRLEVWDLHRVTASSPRN